jgi:hypothetical protein
MDRKERIYNFVHSPERQNEFHLQPRNANGLYHWRAEKHDQFSVREFIAFQGLITEFRKPYKGNPYVKFDMRSWITYIDNYGKVKQHQSRGDIYVEIIPDPSLPGYSNDYDSTTQYVLNTLNPTPRALETML